MKKCTYCGKEYPDDITVCPQDGQSLVAQAPAAFSAGPPPVPTAPAGGLAITSMVLGIVSMVLCGPISGIPAVICGHIALDRTRKSPLQYGGRGFAIAGLVTGYIGCTIICLAFMAGLLLPALSRAKQKAEQINCASNLKQIGLATLIWSNGHDGVLPQSFMDMTNELGNPNILICPADPNHRRSGVGAPLVWNPNNVTYEFLKPGMSLSNLSGQVIVRCPIHGNELYGDGSLHLGTRKRQN